MFKDENLPNTDTHITWERYEYTYVSVKDGQKKKLMLVKKNTPPKEMFTYFRDQVEAITAHQYSANWQTDQLNALKQCLPENTCLVIHDFSENYRCIERNELQSAYFAKTELSIHVSLIYRHAVAEYDEMDEATIVSELFFAISPDDTHDHYFVSRVQEEIKGHLDNLGCQVDNMVEFTDGCSSQYKSKTCMGVSSLLCEKMGYTRFQRNYFEISHAKGPQDAAGGLFKRQLDLAVMKGHSVQNAHDVFNYASANLSKPKTGIFSRRLFTYLTEIDRSTSYTFKAVPQNRRVHQLTTSRPGIISVREQSCYTCDNCLVGQHSCENLHMTGMIRDIAIECSDSQLEEIVEVEEEEDVGDLAVKGKTIAVVADDEFDDYFLMKVTRATHTLNTDSSDDWGISFLAGAQVIGGLYYTVTSSTSDGGKNFKLIKRKKALIDKVAVCFVLDEYI